MYPIASIVFAASVFVSTLTTPAFAQKETDACHPSSRYVCQLSAVAEIDGGLKVLNNPVTFIDVNQGPVPFDDFNTFGLAGEVALQIPVHGNPTIFFSATSKAPGVASAETVVDACAPRITLTSHLVLPPRFGFQQERRRAVYTTVTCEACRPDSLVCGDAHEDGALLSK
ncbi:MAG: hypothetical protein FJ147_02045 [Deltaproteobacteria bacterium]|nr:hypothetical protein [Deltaproteobacteria bacterium]